MDIWKPLADWLIHRAATSPYFDLPGYMNRTWLLGARSARRNDDNPRFVARPTSTFYNWLTDRVAIRVHQILRSDRETALHDHPFSYLTVILRGGYWEVTDGHVPEYGAMVLPEVALPWMSAFPGAAWHLDGGRIAVFHGPGAVLWRPTSFRHKLVLPHGRPAWTLFVIGRRRQTWGFYTESGKVPGKVYAANVKSRTTPVEGANHDARAG